MSEVESNTRHVRKLSWWILALIVTALTSSIITWYVNYGLDYTVKTKVFDYAYLKSSEKVQKSDGSVDCFANGFGSRADVYKCSQENKIYVPCFRDDISNNVKCPDNPKSDDGAKYYLANFTSDIKPLMDTYGNEPVPWYIYLDSGEECRYVYGATTTVANKRLDFTCKDSTVSLYLPVKDSNGTASISCMKNGHLEYCKINEMWR